MPRLLLPHGPDCTRFVKDIQIYEDQIGKLKEQKSELQIALNSRDEQLREILLNIDTMKKDMAIEIQAFTRVQL